MAKIFIIGKFSYLQRDFKIRFLINGFEKGVGSDLEYYLRAEIVEYGIRSYEDFTKKKFKITKGREVPTL